MQYFIWLINEETISEAIKRQYNGGFASIQEALNKVADSGAYIDSQWAIVDEDQHVVKTGEKA